MGDQYYFGVFPGFFGRFSAKNVRFRGITWDFGIGFVWIPNLKKEKKRKKKKSQCPWENDTK